ncbi:adaptor protein MecA [Streptococcus plurextorum]|uniref:adaptor protein MecA n=1 Tax=Streptococcus plurextorum TaxID=456876 RepID=UPI0004287C9C|nr:adaptor protein MecA [Streptococcus plurextorum]
MEMKQINETTLKITISLEDLEERGMAMHDFLIPQEKTEEFFYTVMDELDLPDNFKQSGMLSFRVTPRKDRLDVFVTKSEISQDLNFEDFADFGDMSQMSPEEFFKNLEQKMLEKGDVDAHKRLAEIEAAEEAQDTDVSEAEEELDYVHYVLSFSDFEEVLSFVRTIDFPVEASELYKAEKEYYMTILVSLENQPAHYANLIFARLIEHAQKASKTRSYLQEHGVQLLLDDAVGLLQAIEVA